MTKIWMDWKMWN